MAQHVRVTLDRVRVARRIQNEVDSVGIALAQRLRGVLDFVRDVRFETELHLDVRLLDGSHSDDTRATQFGQLRRETADGAGHADDCDDRAFADVRALDAGQRRQARRGKARRIGVADAIGNVRERLSIVVLRQHRVIGVGTMFGRDAEDALIHGILAHARAHADDDAREILAEYEGQRVSVDVAYFPVDRIDACDGNPYQYVARTRFGNRNVTQGTGLVKMFDDDSAHVQQRTRKGGTVTALARSQAERGTADPAPERGKRVAINP